MRFSHLFILYLRFWHRWSRTSWFRHQISLTSLIFNLLLLQLFLDLLFEYLRSLTFEFGVDTPKFASPMRWYNFFQLQTTPGPAALEVARHQLYKSQALPSFFSSPVASNSSIWMKPFSTSMKEQRWNFTAPKARIRLSSFLPLVHSCSIVIRQWNFSTLSLIKQGWNFPSLKAKIKPSSFHYYWWRMIDCLNSSTSNCKGSLFAAVVLRVWYQE